jgi:phytoene dehydrogenase-like protein
MGGLVAGNALAKRGRSVLILDQQKIPGGCTTNFRRKDFRFDASTHLLNGCEPGGVIYEQLRKIDAHELVEFIKVETIYRWRDLENNLEVSLPVDLAEFVGTLTELFPGEAVGIRDFYARYGALAEFLFASSKAGEEEQPALLEKYGASVMEDFSALQGKTAKEIIAPYVSDAMAVDLITVLAGYFGLCYDQLDAFIFVMGDLSYRLPGEGAYYPKGGSGHLSARLADLFQRRGGRLLLNHRVTQLTFSEGLVDGVLAEKPSGHRFSAKGRCVISDSDLTKLVSDLVPPATFPEDYVKMIQDRVPCCSAVILYVGLDFDIRERGITDYEIHATWGEEMTSSLINEISRTGDYSRLPTASVTAYSNVDPDCCPQGKSVISTICFADPDIFERAIEGGRRRGKTYRALKKRIADQLLEKMAKALDIPDLERHVEVVELATPLTMTHYTLHRNGSFVGWRYTPDQGGMSGIPQQSPVENLLLCGQWVLPGGGVSPVMMGGNNVAEMADAYLGQGDRADGSSK